MTEQKKSERNNLVSIKTKAIFVLDNTAQNRAFLDMFKAMFNNKQYKIRAFGRHSDRKSVFKKHKLMHNHMNDIPVRYSERIVVYIKKK